jgi:hypothetical protein
MALGGIGGGASALDRFQQARDLARRKLEPAPPAPGTDGLARLADLLRKKQAELGRGVAADRPAAAARQAPAGRADFAASAEAGAAAAAAPPAYGRTGATEKAAGPRLGRYIDLTA